MSISRRSLMLTGVAAVAGTQTSRPAASAPKGLSKRICLFTDHLDDHGFTHAEVAKMLAQLGFAGPDLTVRSGGMVEPARAATELPKAVETYRAAGLTVPMITTSLQSPRSPNVREILSAAVRSGVGHFKLGYFDYPDAAQWEARLAQVSAELKDLLALPEGRGLVAGIHNHAGGSVGGALWDEAELLKGLPPDRIGSYFDPAQATIEGSAHAWKLGFHRLKSRMVMLALKDFVWEKTDSGWRTRWVPLGQGAVRWGEFFSLLAKTEFSGPVSLHIEYDPGGSNKAERADRSYAAAERDMKFLQGHLRTAGLE